MLRSIRLGNLPLYLVWNGHDLQLRAVAIGFLSEFLHDAYKLFVVAWDQGAALIQARFASASSFRPVHSIIGFLQGFLLP